MSRSVRSPATHAGHAHHPCDNGADLTGDSLFLVEDGAAKPKIPARHESGWIMPGAGRMPRCGLSLPISIDSDFIVRSIVEPRPDRAHTIAAEVP